MACIDEKGSLTETGRRLLGALQTPRTPEQLAGELALPVFRVRAQLREAEESGVVTERGGAYSRTPLGSSLIEETVP